MFSLLIELMFTLYHAAETEPVPNFSSAIVRIDPD
jgi:hypothetical protein